MSKNIPYGIINQPDLYPPEKNPHAGPPRPGPGCDAQHHCQAQTDGPGSLLYLSSNNTDEIEIIKENLLTPYHKKQAYVLNENCKRFIEKCGLENVGFLTLTFPDNVVDPQEAYRRFCSMRKMLLSKFFGDWILVKERQQRGAWHYHILIDCRGDIRTGIDFAAIAQGDYGSASKRLKALWALLRTRLPIYGFGRSELLPIKSSSEAVARYVGKYISKHIGARKEKDKGVRLVSYSTNQVRSSVKLAWNTDGAKEWRRKLRKFATKTKCYNLEALKMTFGRSWAYHLSAYIEAVDTLTNSEIQRIRHIYDRFRKDDSPNLLIEDSSLIDLATGQVLF